MHTSILRAENVVTGSWSPVTKDTQSFLLVLVRINLRKVSWWVQLWSFILPSTNHWIQANYSCPAWFPRITVCTEISNSAGRSSHGGWGWKCPAQMEYNFPPPPAAKGGLPGCWLVLITLNIPNNTEFKDGEPVLRLGTDFSLYLEWSSSSSPWPTDATWCGTPPPNLTRCLSV